MTKIKTIKKATKPLNEKPLPSKEKRLAVATALNAKQFVERLKVW
jgi:hypothetical protein